MRHGMGIGFGLQAQLGLSPCHLLRGVGSGGTAGHDFPRRVRFGQRLICVFLCFFVLLLGGGPPACVQNLCFLSFFCRFKAFRHICCVFFCVCVFLNTFAFFKCFFVFFCAPFVLCPGAPLAFVSFCVFFCGPLPIFVIFLNLAVARRKYRPGRRIASPTARDQN